MTIIATVDDDKGMFVASNIGQFSIKNFSFCSTDPGPIDNVETFHSISSVIEFDTVKL